MVRILLVLENHILQLENSLLKPEVRQSAEKTTELLAEDFIEFTSSGHIWRYDNTEAISTSSNVPELNWEIKDFEIKQLSNDCILALYKVIKHNYASEDNKYSNRSSIWKCFDDKWKMVFHQGTLTSEFQDITF